MALSSQRIKNRVSGNSGTPDIVFSRLRKVILVHGCFWHQHPKCRLARLPKSRLDYWIPKLKRNRQRDLEVQLALAQRGWDVLVVWECQAASVQAAALVIAPFLTED